MGLSLKYYIILFYNIQYFTKTIFILGKHSTRVKCWFCCTKRAKYLHKCYTRASMPQFSPAVASYLLSFLCRVFPRYIGKNRTHMNELPFYRRPKTTAAQASMLHSPYTGGGLSLRQSGMFHEGVPMFARSANIGTPSWKVPLCRRLRPPPA